RRMPAAAWRDGVVLRRREGGIRQRGRGGLMPAETTITYGLVLIAIAIVVATIRVVTWLNRRWQETEDRIVKQLGDFRADIQAAQSSQRQDLVTLRDDL